MRYAVALGLAITVTTPSLGAAAAPADWIVTGEQVVTDASLLIEGNLRVKSGASLTLRNVRLHINSPADGHYAIVAEPGSSLRIENCRISPAEAGRRFLFYVERARFVFTGNELRGAGYGFLAESRSLGLALIDTQGAVIEGNTIYHEKASGLALERARYTTVRDNRIIHLGEGAFGIHLVSSSDNLVAGNTVVGQNEAILVQQHSFNNRVVGNTIRDSLIGIFVRHGAGNNLIENNTIIASQKPTFWALAVDKTASPNMFLGNTVQGALAGLLASYTSHLVAANNLFADFAPAHAPANLGAIHLFRTSHAQLLNNRIERSRDGGITLLFSSENRLAGNRVTDSGSGITLFYDSDYNRIEGNLLRGNRVNIVLEKSVGNTLANNHLETGAAPDFDRGGNAWSANFWHDYRGADRGDGRGAEPRRILPSGLDPEPLLRPPALEQIPVPGWSALAALPESIGGTGHWRLHGHTVCENQALDYIWGWVIIGPGSSLVLRNCTLRASSHWVDEPVIWVQEGGSLHIVNSTVMAAERDVPLSITVEPGARLEIRDSVFRRLGWTPGVEHGLRVRSDGAIIENSRFEDCFSCITIEGGQKHRVIGNRITRAQFGLLAPPWIRDSEISRNEITDTVEGFNPLLALDRAEPLLPEIHAVVNAASLQPGPLAPGSLATIFGRFLARRAEAGAAPAFTLGGASVRVCGAPARLFYTSSRQINLLVPLSAATRNECDVVVTTSRLDGGGQAITPPARIAISPSAIALFEFRPLRSDGVPVAPASYLPVITDAHNRLIGPRHFGAPGLIPASPGQVLVLWGTGGGLTSPPVPDHENAPAGGSPLPLPPPVTIAGRQAHVAYAGLAPGYSGLYQFNVQVPYGVPRGQTELRIGDDRQARTYPLWIE